MEVLVGHDVEYGFLPNSMENHGTSFIKKVTDLIIV